MIAAALKQLDAGIGEFILQKTPRVRYQMWNGQWHAAVKRMHEIYNAAKTGLKVEPATDAERLQRFRRHLFELKGVSAEQKISPTTRTPIATAYASPARRPRRE